MKLFKKVGAVFLVLAMIAVMIPQLESKVVKAATPTPHSITASTYGDKLDSFFTASPRGTSSQSKITDSLAKGYTAALKTNSGFGYTFTLTDKEFAVLKILAHTRSDKGYAAADFFVSEVTASETKELDRVNVAKAADVNVDPDEYTFVALMTNGTYRIDTTNEMALYKVQVDVYTTQTDAEAIIKEEQNKRASQVTVDLSGTITSDIPLTGGTIKIKGADGVVKESAKIEKSGDNTYSYVVKEVNGNLKYVVESINSDDLTATTKLVSKSKLNKIEFTVESTAYENADFTVSYYDLPANEWNFTNLADWSEASIQFAENSPKTLTYKGLVVDVTNGGKFATNADNIQINEKTKVKIPVTGYGEVICTFNSKVKTKLTTETNVTGVTVEETTNNVKFTGDDSYVELEMIGASCLQKIEISPSPIQDPVVLCGAAVREETEGWGNGIRFGAQLDLTKVDVENCESGTLIGLESIVGEGKKMTMNDVNQTCRAVKRTTYIKMDEENNKLEYAAALINIPDGTNETVNALDTEIVARSYVKVGDNVYYGEQITTTYNKVAAAVSAAQ